VTAPEPIPAATVVLVRDGDDGLETLMLHRGDTREFGGMWVFPGGRIDADDYLADRPDDLDAAARRAAVREAAEEVALDVDGETLVGLSHWLPPPIAPKRFATWFFLAPAPPGAVVVDGGEIHDHRWLAPADALQRHATGEIAIVPPTWVTLHQLAGHDTVADAIADAATRDPVPHYVTHMARENGLVVALWHGDAGYEAGDPAVAGPRNRLYLDDGGGWRYERSD
jgi:8-oxo-dGTP pyrophosphatase MutT (NUDIX family)